MSPWTVGPIKEYSSTLSCHIYIDIVRVPMSNMHCILALPTIAGLPLTGKEQASALQGSWRLEVQRRITISSSDTEKCSMEGILYMASSKSKEPKNALLALLPKLE